MTLWSGLWNWFGGRASAAALARADVGPQRPTAAMMTHLAHDLTHREAFRRRLAAEQLAELGHDAEDVIPDLILGLTDIDDPVRQDVARALQRIDPNWAAGPRAVEAVPRLLRALTSSFGKVSHAAAAILGQIGAAAVPGLLATLEREGDDVARVGAAQTLGRIRVGAEEVVPALAQALRGENVGVRQAAAEALGAFGPEAASASPALTATLIDWSPPVRLSVAVALGRIGPAAASAAPALTPLLADNDGDVRASAIDALAKFGSSVVSGMIDLLRERNPQRFADRDGSFRHAREEERIERIHQAAAVVLGRLGLAAREAVPDLLAAVAHADARIREAAVRALGRIGPEAAAAIEAVAIAQVDAIAFVRTAAFEALPAIDPTWGARPETASVLAVFVTKMTGPSEGVCKAAREALVRSGVAAVPGLTAALSAPDRVAREAAADVLGILGPMACDAVPALAHVAEHDGSQWVREAATRALGRVTPPSQPSGRHSR